MQTPERQEGAGDEQPQDDDLGEGQRTLCQAKKIQVHSALATSWATYNRSATAAPRKPCSRQTSQAATPMRMYSTVQTGPNTQAGGAQDGCASPP